MQLSKHFVLREFTKSDTATSRGLSNAPNASELSNLTHMAAQLEKIRAHIGAPIVITSGFRSEAVNKAVGGVATSAHRLGLAVDCRAPGFGTARLLAEAIVSMQKQRLIDFDQVILYSNRIHLGFKLPESKNRRQSLTARVIRGRTSYQPGFI